MPLAQVCHIGSTSVPGLVSKPPIDVLVCVEPVVSSDQIVEALESMGYQFRPASFADSAERHLFFRLIVQGHRREHVHVVDAGSDLA